MNGNSGPLILIVLLLGLLAWAVVFRGAVMLADWMLVR